MLSRNSQIFSLIHNEIPWFSKKKCFLTFPVLKTGNWNSLIFPDFSKAGHPDLTNVGNRKLYMGLVLYFEHLF